MTAIFIYVTAPSEIEAKAIADAVVQDRLAACANMIPGIKSIYHWKGKIEEAQETVIIFKTRASLFQAVEARVKELHKFATPCIVALPVVTGSAAYLDWIMDETKP
ncbi:MAG TPA: divalent-cation tolerance protein CutA [Patescibacteria group bacterium]|nr:divalent-cation tolerance protein CutA [Patescibacteria group bacterium]